MTGYSTVIPGMENDNNHTAVDQSNDESTKYMGNPYQYDSPNSQQTVVAGADSASGTRIPGMNEATNFPSSEPKNTQSTATSNGKPMVGFLVSVSRTEEGEYWVLRQGQNTIGSNPSNDIVLSESSVSSTHAVLAIHRNPNESNKLNVGMIDRGSSNGTFVNKNYIGFNPYQCKNLDKISIGNYEMLLMLFDHIEYDMAKSDKF